MRTQSRSGPSRFLRTGVVALAGAALLASCAPQPDAGSSDASTRRPRQRATTTTVAAPGQERPAPSTTVPAPTTTVPTTVPPTTTTAPAPPAGTPQPLGPAGPWKLRFSDDFDGSSLDLTKWRPNWFGSTDGSITRPINDYEESCYDPAQVTVSGGVLNLTATRLTSSRPGCTKKNGAAASYASGMVMSEYDYNFTYGYIEARINLPGRAGVPENWAAFWANGQDWPATGEIDVMESLGGEPRWHFHYESGGSHQSKGSADDLISPKTGWHTFGALWEPGKITFYYDGRQVGTVTSGVTSQPMYLILNHGLSNYISGPIVTPSTMQVDYVRHWQR